MAWEDFSVVLDAFRMENNVTLEFLRLSPVSPVFAFGQAVEGSAVYVAFLLSPVGYAVVPRVPKEFLAQLDVGDRQRDRILVWTYSTPGEAPQLKTIDQLDHARADRVRDVTNSKDYICETEWSYPRQSALSGVICKLLDQ